MIRFGAVSLAMLMLLLAPNAAMAQDSEPATDSDAADSDAADSDAEDFLVGVDPETDEDTEETTDEPTEPGNETSEELDDDAAAFLAGDEPEPEIAAPVEEEGAGWAEPPDQRYWMVGARWRMIFIPDWLLDAFFNFDFGEGNNVPPAAVTVVQAAGAEFTTRKNRLSIIGSVWWAGYFTHDAFVADDEGETGDPEFITSDISLLFFTVDFIHSYMFTDWFGITYGAGLGLGVKIAGDVRRTEARREGRDFVRCSHDEVATISDCDDGEDTNINSVEDAVWPVFPWINIMLGFRFKVFRHLEINVEGGAGLGFIFGTRVNYIF